MNLCMCLWVSLGLGIHYPVFMCKHICMCGYVSIFHLLNKTFYDSLEAQVPGQSLGMRFMLLCLCSLSIRLCPTLCDPMDCSLPCSSVHGILQAIILECIAMPSCRGSSQPRDRTWVSCVFCIAGGFLLLLSHQRRPCTRYTETQIIQCE